MKNKFELGHEVKDIVTGFKGITMSRIEYLTGCTQYGVQLQKKSHDTDKDYKYFDETRLKATGKKITLQAKGEPARDPSKGADLPVPRNQDGPRQ
jgi:hypothetical protein